MATRTPQERVGRWREVDGVSCVHDLHSLQ
jgi:hypothetical protein